MSCSCHEWDGEEGWCFYEPEDFSKFQRKRRKRCSSCKELVNIGDDCLEFVRERSPCSEIEMNICGDTVPMSSLIMCEKCGEIYLNLTAVKYCMSPDEDMRGYMKEYHRLTGFDPEKYK